MSEAVELLETVESAVLLNADGTVAEELVFTVEMMDCELGEGTCLGR